MGFQVLNCPVCGEHGLEKRNDEYFCKYCGSTCTDDAAERAYRRLVESMEERLGKALDEAFRKEKEERFYALRSNLWEKAHEEYIDSAAIVEICKKIKEIAPHDYVAEFYQVANGAPMKKLIQFLNQTDVAEQALYIERMLEFLLKSLTSELIAPVNYLIERAYKNTNLVKFENYISKLEREAKKVDNGVYETGIPRDVFIAYASEDIQTVLDLASYLEENELSCFVAMRNLQHGKGAVDNYEKELQNAIDNCKIVVFVSSKHSRSIKRDALRVELPYIKKKDIENAPAGCRLNYVTMPTAYKKPRIEYRLDNEKTAVADIILREFFNGLDYCETQEKVLERVVRYVVGEEPQAEPVSQKEEIATTVLQPVVQPTQVSEQPKMQQPVSRKEEIATTVASTPPQEEGVEVSPTVYEPVSAEQPMVKEQPKVIKNEVDLTLVEEEPKIQKIDSYDFIVQDGVLKKYNGNASVVYVPSGIKEISPGAFKKKNVIEVILPDGLKTIGGNIFKGGAFKKCLNLKSIKIPHSVTLIGDCAFEGCKSLLRVEMPNCLTSIGDWAFSGCKSLTRIEIPDGVISIGSSAFWDCLNLSGIVINVQLQTIQSHAFGYCNKLTAVYYKGNFQDWSRLNIGRNNSCLTNAKRYYAEDASMQPQVIQEEVAPTLIEIQPKVEENQPTDEMGDFSDYADNGNNDKVVVWEEDSLSSIEKHQGDLIYTLFNNEYAVTSYTGEAISISIPSVWKELAVTSIREGAFSKCMSLKNIKIQEGVTSIKKHAFFACRYLESIVIGKDLTSIENEAFRLCSNLNQVYYQGSLQDWEKIHIGAYNFDLTKAKRYYYSDKQPTISGDFWHYDENGEVEIWECKLKDDINQNKMPLDNRLMEDTFSIPYIVENAATVLNNRLVYELKGKEYIVKGHSGLITDSIIPNTYKGIPVVSIKNDAYYRSATLTNIVIGDNIKTIEKETFSYCRNLKSVVLGNGVEAIGKWAFFDCVNLTNIVINVKLKKIYNSAFLGCNRLKAVYYKGTVKEWDKMHIGGYNFYLTSATRYYYSETQPTTSGNYWHYDENGDIAVW